MSDQPDDSAQQPDQGAEIVHLDTVRAGRHPYPPTSPDAEPDGEVMRVDRAGGETRDWITDLAEKARTRRPIVPLWLRSRAEALSILSWVAAHYVYVAGYQASRAPLYAGRLAVRSPRGFGRLVGGFVRWTFDLEGEPVRLATVQKADPDAYLKLSRQRDARVRLRALGALLVMITLVIVSILVASAPTPAQWAALAFMVALLGVLGRPADRPLIDRAVIPTSVEKLTSDVVIRALGSLGIAAINQAIAKNSRNPLDFKAPITRDGPGWRADVDLPYGVTVAEVMDRRDKLASGLRRPLGCVWPETVPEEHTGRLMLWVGDQDMNKARQPAWPLGRSGSADLFKSTTFATDQRGRFVGLTLMFVSVIIGSIPRMGKTFLLRLLALIAALDPRTELHVYDLKGTGDLSALECVAHRYRAGDDDEDIEYAIAGMRALREELRRRAKVIRGLPKDICPESKVTPELAGNRSLGLHPIVIPVDECQVWFEHERFGAEFEAICTDLVKRGPALGMVLILATQRPDAKALPTGISANAAVRLCLKVMGQMENDMVLGTSAYKNGVRATMFSFNDKGICYFSGEGENPRIVRCVYLDAPAAEKIALRARAMRERAGTLSGHAVGEGFDATEAAQGSDLLADIAAVASEPKLWNEVVVDRLAELRPEAYGPWAALTGSAKSAQLTNALKPYGVKTGQVWGTTADGKGANRTGITRDDITHALTERDARKRAGAAS
ncbi:cell division protein FtsK [Spongiactinospora sp. TRM90649]|uniref:cell division protein FtsK n=1 Tax=Spongiactinospora sp. TRM90649 TaxID=3031114 RepID=UPI0023F79A5A|nr:cell division protein FtsK [Spongiactinospora sp. TRM90649]MDF5751953.1 cell division protein FtsK [Spongiactinospora sp. TRM90649]